MPKRKRYDDCFHNVNQPVSALLCLPDNIILKILSFLDTYSLVCASKVCLKLNQVGHDISLWSCLDVRQMNLSLKSLWKLSRSKLTDKTKEFHIQGDNCNDGSASMEKLSLAYFNNLRKQSPSLKIFSIEYFDMRDIPLSVLPQTIENLSLYGSMLTMGWFDALKSENLLSLLKILNLQCCTKVTNSDLESLSYLCNLETLLLTMCYRISARGIPYIIDKMKNLSVLDFSGCPGVNDVALKYISKLTKLKILRIRNCHHITDIGIKSLFAFTVGATLRELDMLGCHEVTDDGISFMSSSARELQKLNVWGCKVSKSTLALLTNRLTKCDIFPPSSSEL